MTMFTDEFVEGFDDLPKAEQKACILQITKQAGFQFQWMSEMIAAGRLEEADAAFNKGLDHLHELKCLVEGNRVEYEAIAKKLMEMSGQKPLAEVEIGDIQFPPREI